MIHLELSELFSKPKPSMLQIKMHLEHTIRLQGDNVYEHTTSTHHLLLYRYQTTGNKFEDNVITPSTRVDVWPVWPQSDFTFTHVGSLWVLCWYNVCLYDISLITDWFVCLSDLVLKTYRQQHPNFPLITCTLVMIHIYIYIYIYIYINIYIYIYINW